MLKIDRQGKRLDPISKSSLTAAKILECQDLQEYIAKSWEDVADEMDEPGLKLIGREVQPSSIVADRIDMLALDEDGTLVVIELKRAKHKFQLIQAMAYAAMIAKLRKDEISALLSDKTVLKRLDDAAQFNRGQRIILIAEEFDYEVLVTSEWLYEKDIDVKCVKISLCEDKDTRAEYLNFSAVFPPNEIEDEAKIRRAKAANTIPSGDWDSIIATAKNGSVKAFFQKYISEGQENRVAYRALHFRFDGTRVFSVGFRTEDALVEQARRFQGDQEFWRSRLSPGTEVYEVFGGRRIRFRLSSPQDFTAFTRAIDTELKEKNVVWEPVRPIAASDGTSPS